MKTQRLNNESDFGFFCRCVGMSSAAGMFAETCALSLDTAKIRLQVQKV